MEAPKYDSTKIRGTGKVVHFWRSQFHEKIGAPEPQCKPKLGHLYVHHFGTLSPDDPETKSSGDQVWMGVVDSRERDEVTGKATVRYAWKRVFTGISHPDPDLHGHELVIGNDGNPRWMLHNSARNFRRKARVERRRASS